MKKISVVISAHNEEAKIEDCLRSVVFADEIILVDGSSADGTTEIGKKYKAKIFIRSNNPMLNVNKNFGFTKASNDWILSLDADERVTLELKMEIEAALNKKNDLSGYWISRKNIIFGKWIRHAGWYPDHQLRLFKKGKGIFEEKHVHEMIKVKGSVGYLNGDILHYNYETIAQFIKKMALYTQSEAADLISSGYILSWKDAIRMPMKEFLSRFFSRKGYLDGLHGLVMSILMAFYHFIIFASVWEKQNFKEYNSKSFIKEVDKELSNSSREIKHWVRGEDLENIKNPIYKNIKKITSRLPAN